MEHSIRVNDGAYEPNLDKLTLRMMGLEDLSDEDFEEYLEIFDRRSKKMSEEFESINKQAVKTYWELVNLRKNLKASL